MHNLDRVLNQQMPYNEAQFGNSPFGGPLTQPEFGSDNESFGMYDEVALATELLSVGSEPELEQFLGGLLNTVAKGVSNFAKSGVGRAVGGALKQVAKAALPTVSAAIGSAIPIPGVGTAAGALVGNALASALEMEAADGQDHEFEVAQNVVRLAANAIERAVNAPPGANPTVVANQAIKGALRAVQGAVGVPTNGRAQSGRWVRRGNEIVLLGV